MKSIERLAIRRAALWLISVICGFGVLVAAFGCTTAATSPPPAPITTGTFGGFTQLAFDQQPTATLVNANISPPVTVALEDANGHLVTSDNSTLVTLTLHQVVNGSCSCAVDTLISGTLTQKAKGGLATFNDLSIPVADDYFLAASAPVPNDFAAQTSSLPFTVADQGPGLEFNNDPLNTMVNTPIGGGPVEVDIFGDNGNIDTSDSTSQIQLSLTSPNGATLSGQTLVTVHNGVALFNSTSNPLEVNLPGTYTLTATDVTDPTSVAHAISASFTVADAPTQLGYKTAAGTSGQPPMSVDENTNFTVSVAIQDAQGHTVTGASPTLITLTLNNAAGATLSGNTATTSNGVATFTTLQVSQAGTGYTLSASATGLTTGISNAFNATVVTAPSTGHLFITGTDASGTNVAFRLDGVQTNAPAPTNVTIDVSGFNLSSLGKIEANGSGSLDEAVMEAFEQGGVPVLLDVASASQGTSTLTPTGVTLSGGTATFFSDAVVAAATGNRFLQSGSHQFDNVLLDTFNGSGALQNELSDTSAAGNGQMVRLATAFPVPTLFQGPPINGTTAQIGFVLDTTNSLHAYLNPTTATSAASFPTGALISTFTGGIVVNGVGIITPQAIAYDADHNVFYALAVITPDGTQGQSGFDSSSFFGVYILSASEIEDAIFSGQSFLGSPTFTLGGTITPLQAQNSGNPLRCAITPDVNGSITSLFFLVTTSSNNQTVYALQSVNPTGTQTAVPLAGIPSSLTNANANITWISAERK